MERVDFSLPPPQIIGARGHIGIARRPHLAQLVVELDAAIEFAECRDRERIFRPAELLSDSDRQEKQIQPVTDEIAQGGWADKREIEIGSRLHAIIAQRIGKAVTAVGQLEWLSLCDIDQPGGANRRVDYEAPQRLCCLARLQLQQEVHEDDRFAKVMEEVASDPFGSGGARCPHRRTPTERRLPCRPPERP